MNLLTGVDLVETDRIARAIERQGEAFLMRVYTQQELDLCRGNSQSLAARFAAKEAVSKALGTGFAGFGFTDVEVLRGTLGEPLLTLHGNAATLAKRLGVQSWSISLSHTQQHAIAMVVALVVG